MFDKLIETLEDQDWKLYMVVGIAVVVLACLSFGFRAVKNATKETPTQTVVPWTETPDYTPTITQSPTVTLTPTITLTPTKTLTPTPTKRPAEFTATAIKKTQVYMEKYESIARQELINYADNHKGERIKIPGRVLNIIDDRTFQIYIAGSYDAVIVYTKDSFTGLYENHNVEVYGTVNGMYCGTNA